MQVLIVDDEAYARSSLLFLIKEHCTEIQHIHIAKSVAEAKEIVELHKIELIFLDIAMPNENGFELLPFLNKNKTFVIFTTAYDQYAIKAIKASAVDYLLKPIDIEELKNATEKAKKLIHAKGVTNESIQQLQDNLSNAKGIQKLTLPDVHGSKIIEINQIIRIEADSNYSTFFLLDNNKITVAKSLKEYEDILPENTFFRVHKSDIVNLNHIKKYLKSDLTLILVNEDKVLISRRKSALFSEKLKNITL